MPVLVVFPPGYPEGSSLEGSSHLAWTLASKGWSQDLDVPNVLVLPHALPHHRHLGVGLCRPESDSSCSCPAKDPPLPLEPFNKPLSLLTNPVALFKT